MKTYFGVDYRKKFSYGTIMNEKGIILKQGTYVRALFSHRRLPIHEICLCHLAPSVARPLRHRLVWTRQPLIL
ncbi:MAG: hypothetical protein JSV50_04220 [Desulfobacteraceae bacterium]|nr:MAG: hypothetical protein JSV50_04220 [Desulfobacteraceae bacterium]